MKIEDFIKSEAYSCGIDAVGIADIYDSEKIKKILKERKLKKRELEFEQCDIESRISPERLLEGYKSAVAIAISYNFKVETENVSGIRGVISKSSIGTDYHVVIREKAEELVERIKNRYPTECYIGVDTSPLLDREFALRGGIGYFGKNSSIISPEFGSAIFLGYILTELELKGEGELEESCGSCDICVRACPTGAIQGDYSIDPKKCVSYLTQTKTVIPFEFREKMGFKIYGCDVCQNVCPKNKGVKQGCAESFKPFRINSYVNIEHLLDITNREFKETYGKTSSGWRGKNVLKRNAIIAIGNSGDIRYTERLKELLKDQSRMIKEYALWSLLKLDFEPSRLYLEREEFGMDEELRSEYESICKYVEGGKRDVK